LSIVRHTTYDCGSLAVLGALALAACKGRATGAPAPTASPPHAGSAVPSVVSAPPATAQSHAGGGNDLRHDLHPVRHVPHDPATDKPVVHPLRDLYQQDRHFANIFSKSGQSEICGPTALSNVLIYLKHQHAPAYGKLLGHIKDSDQNAHDVVEEMFKLCHTDKNSGTSANQLKSCAGATLQKSGYSALVLKDAGVWAGEGALKRPLGPAELRAEAKSSWKAGDPPDRSDRGAVLLFGWYDRKTYKRDGGHFVALAGYDEKNPSVVYVTNPLIKDYPKDHVYSKVLLERVDKKGALPAAGMWETQHLFGDSASVIAVLEEMVAVLPKQ
jgi:hypothetical protein